MPVNVNWGRWTFASMSGALKTAITAYPFKVEGQVVGEGDVIQLRMAGPTWKQESQTKWRGMIMFNTLVQCLRDDADFHKIHKMCGVVEDNYINCIPVMKFGNGPDDDPTVLVGNLIRYHDIQTTHYGQLALDVPSIQSTVEAHYYIDLID